MAKNRPVGNRIRPPAARVAPWVVAMILVACSRPPGGSGLASVASVHPSGEPQLSSGARHGAVVTVLSPDSIRSIDAPTFRSASQVHNLSNNEPVVSLEVRGDARAYPVEILIWHEIVNDTVGGVPVVVTYCPLCNSAIVFRRPLVNGEPVEFGVSGKLYQSNLVMYDRTTNSLWPQELGRAIDGPLAGTELRWAPSQMLSWEDWRAAHPDGQVLERPPGRLAPIHAVGVGYGLNPYIGYDRPGSRPPYFVGRVDRRLPPKERVVGIAIGRDALAVPYPALRLASTDGWAVVAATVAGRPVIVFWHGGTVSAVDQGLIRYSRGVGDTGVFAPRLGGRRLSFRVSSAGIEDTQTGSRWNIVGRAVSGAQEGRRLTPLIALDSFWFSWATAHPKTAIYRA